MTEFVNNGSSTPGEASGRTVVLKLGGSVITEKDTPETVAQERLEAAAKTIGEAEVSNLVVVHGGGSFGHPAAEAAGVSLTDGTTDTAAIREIHAAMGRLNEAVLDALTEAGVPALPVRPFSAGYRTETGDVEMPGGGIQAMLEEGFVPVLHGDVFVTAEKGATIVSGDELVVSIAENLDAGAVGLCTTVPGVLDEEKKVIPRIEAFETVETVLGGSEATDVTGGMAGKVRALLGLEGDAHIFDLDGLATFLHGNAPGTVIGGKDGSR